MQTKDPPTGNFRPSPRSPSASDAVDRPLTAAAAERIALLLKQAFQRIARLPGFASQQGLHVVAGDDVEITLTEDEKGPPKQIVKRNPEPKLATIGLPVSAVELLREAAAVAQEDLRAADTVDLDAIIASYTRALQRWALKGLPTAATIGDEIDEAIAEVTGSIRPWDVWIPLVNLRLHDLSSFHFGGLVIRPNVGVREELLSRIEPMMASAPVSEDERRSGLQTVGAMLSYYDQVPTSVATVTTISAEGTAQWNALAEAEATINLLRCYLPLVAPQGQRCWFGIGGSVGSERHVVARSDQELTSFHVDVMHRGYLQPFVITPALVTMMTTDLALEEVRAVASAEARERTRLQNAIIVAGQFLGRAAITDDDSLSLVLSASAIDGMLYSSASGSKSARRERVRRLLRGTGTPPDLAVNQYDQITRLRNHLIYKGPVRFDVTFRQAAEILGARLFCTLAQHTPEHGSLDAVWAALR